MNWCIILAGYNNNHYNGAYTTLSTQVMKCPKNILVSQGTSDNAILHKYRYIKLLNVYFGFHKRLYVLGYIL